MQRREFFAALTVGASAAAARQTNIVLIYSDDVQDGDLSCQVRPGSAPPTWTGRAGVRFTDLHASSATCTSRYALLTGEYAWRKPRTGILPRYAPLNIQPGRANVASLLKQQGYRSGVVGKWHLGLGRKGMGWNGVIPPGPLAIGFDYSFVHGHDQAIVNGIRRVVYRTGANRRYGWTTCRPLRRPTRIT
jgi:arylsulfatase A-like enzyme